MAGYTRCTTLVERTRVLLGLLLFWETLFQIVNFRFLMYAGQSVFVKFKNKKRMKKKLFFFFLCEKNGERHCHKHALKSPLARAEYF